jgi:dienelactone hydrolase
MTPTWWTGRSGSSTGPTTTSRRWRRASPTLQATGKDAQLTAYEGAYHGFDSPGTPLTRVQVGDSLGKRGSCELYEQPAGRIMNRQTGLPFTRNDECLKGVGTLGYDARAHATVIADVTGLLQRVFKLQPHDST